MTTSMPRAAPLSASWATRAGCAIACRRLMAARCPRSTRARCASCARRLAYADGLADFAFAMQGLGSGPITFAGSRGAEGTLASGRCQRKDDRGVRAVGARRGFGCRRDDVDRSSRRRFMGDRRRQDVDFEWRDRRFLLRLRARGGNDGHAWHLGVCRAGGNIRACDRGTHRCDRAPSAGAACLRWLPRAGERADRRGR